MNCRVFPSDTLTNVKFTEPNHSQKLSKYLTTRIPTASPADTVRDIEARLVHGAGTFSSLDYVFLVDAEHRFKGLVPVREIFRDNKDARLSHLKLPEIFSVHPHSHPERAAYLALKHGVQAIPVIDQEEKLVGAITAASLLKIVDTGAIEDMLRRGGLVHKGAYENIFNVSLTQSFVHRAPWLAAGLVGGLIAAWVIGDYEEFLSQNVILAAFIPLLVYMADAVGTQMESYIVRDLAVHPELPFGSYAFRQTSVTLGIAFVAGLCIYAAGVFLYGDPALGLVLAISLGTAILSSVLTGLFLPYLFEKLSYDPATASGPVGTIVQDLLTIIIYFAVATAILP